MNKTITYYYWSIILTISFLRSQNTLNNIVQAKSDFVPEIKQSEKFSEVPSILEEAREPVNFHYSIQSFPFQPSYTIQPVFPATLKNEPKKSLYYSHLRLGYSPFYSMPLAQWYIANTHSRNYHLEADFSHLSSSSAFNPFPTTSFSDNILNLNGKKFYKKHTLLGQFRYERNVLYYYGYNTELNQIPKDRINFLRQRYHLFHPSVILKSHFTDTTKINHTMEMAYYHYGTLYGEYENHVKAIASTDMYLHGEHFTAHGGVLYYNNRQTTDTNNHTIIFLNPAFNAKGRQWTARLGFRGTLTFDQQSEIQRFYFHPDVLLEYDLADKLIIPFVRLNGFVQRNSLYQLTRENPFADTILTYANTNYKTILQGGLKGKLSSHTNYLVSATYSITENLPYFFTNYKSLNLLHNYYTVLYQNSSVLHLNGEIRFQLLEKWRVNMYGNYYHFRPDSSMKPYHKPEYSLGMHAQYYLGNKILLGLYGIIVGKRWALDTNTQGNLKDIRIQELIDINFEAEYRYSKFLGFFLRLNNLANQQYAVWDKYPTYRFFGMLGLTFIPF